MSRVEITDLLERGAGTAPEGPDVDQLWGRGRRRRAVKRTGASVAAVAAVAVAVVALRALVTGWTPRVDIGPVDSAPSPMVREVPLPDAVTGRAQLARLVGRTGAVVVAVRDGEADFVEIDSGEVTSRVLPELAPGDPLFRIVGGDRLVLYGGDEIYAMAPHGDAQVESIFGPQPFSVFVPSGVPDRVWVRPGRTGPISQIDVQGNVLIGPTRSPGGSLVVGLRDGVVLQRDDRLIVWDPTTDEILQQVDGPFPMGTDGRRFAWCDHECGTLHLADPEAGTSTLVAQLPDGFSFVGYSGRISPDGRYLASPLCVSGPDGRCALAVLDLHTDRAWTVADGWVTGFPAPAWSPDGRWVFTTTDDGRLAAYQPGETQAVLVPIPRLAGALGLAVIATPGSGSPDPSAIRLDGEDIQALAAAATHDPSLDGHIVRDDEILAAVWRMGDVSGNPPMLPDGTVGVFVIARHAESTCRSPADVVAVEIVEGQALVLLDRDGEFMRSCPGPDGSHAFTAFLVAIPDTYSDKVGGATSRLVAR